eukprot:GHVT01100802.1.p2 GENE.GHVT01100802.1~~GHVT01100802.1.p2  ORF type:complete len:152 (+),score=11.61 GHVT01100802.1:1709-2164(+)
MGEEHALLWTNYRQNSSPGCRPCGTSLKAVRMRAARGVCGRWGAAPKGKGKAIVDGSLGSPGSRSEASDRGGSRRGVAGVTNDLREEWPPCPAMAASFPATTVKGEESTEIFYSPGEKSLMPVTAASLMRYGDIKQMSPKSSQSMSFKAIN